MPGDGAEALGVFGELVVLPGEREFQGVELRAFFRGETEFVRMADRGEHVVDARDGVVGELIIQNLPMRIRADCRFGTERTRSVGVSR